MALYQRGSLGPEVAKIQGQLQQLGLCAGPVDENFGGGTESGVKAFQQANGLAVDGRVGPGGLGDRTFLHRTSAMGGTADGKDRRHEHGARR